MHEESAETIYFEENVTAAAAVVVVVLQKGWALLFHLTSLRPLARQRRTRPGSSGRTVMYLYLYIREYSKALHPTHRPSVRTLLLLPTKTTSQSHVASYISSGLPILFFNIFYCLNRDSTLLHFSIS